MEKVPVGLQPSSHESPRKPVAIGNPGVALVKSRRRGTLIYVFAVVIIIAILSFFLGQTPAWPLFLNIELFIKIHTPFLLWQPIAGWWPLLMLVGLALVSVLVLIISLPLSWYLSVALPRRYGLRQDGTLGWLRSVGRRLLMVSLPVWSFAELGTFLLVVQPQTWWAWITLAQFFYTLLLARFGARWLLPWLNNMTPLHDSQLTERLQVLLVRLHLPPCKLFQVSIGYRTTAANAYFIGWGRGRRILLTDTLIQHFTLDEIEVILAHELGHLAHHDIWTRIGMSSLIVLGTFYLLYLDLTDDSWLNTLFTSLPVLQPFSPLLALLFFFVLWNFTMYYRQYQEYQADEFALQATSNVQAFKTSMIRLTNMNRLATTTPRRFRLPASHPVLQQRLQHADAFALRQAGSLVQA